MTTHRLTRSRRRIVSKRDVAQAFRPADAALKRCATVLKPALSILAAVLLQVSCAEKPPADRVRVSGQVEATEVRAAAPVGGRLVELRVAEGDRVKAGDLIAQLDTADAQLAIARVKAERDQADAQLRLLRAGARPEDIRQAEAQRATTEA